MASVKEFVEVRMNIETLVDEIISLVERGAMQDSRQHLAKANQQLEVLKAMVANNVQELAASRLARQLYGLGTKVEEMTAKTAVKKTVKEKRRKGAV